MSLPVEHLLPPFLIRFDEFFRFHLALLLISIPQSSRRSTQKRTGNLTLILIKSEICSFV